ncbi:hypothetical protein LPJ66_007502, partial [Kickxella alabastrina]
AGKIYDIIDKNANGWWLGLREGIEGWVPSNYLNPDPEASVRGRAPPSAAAPAAPNPAAALRASANGNGVAGQQADSMAQLAAALTSRNNPNGNRSNAPARPGLNRFTQEESDEEDVW